MNYQAFTNESLIMIHRCASGALAVDEELSRLGQAPRFRVRETPDWKKHVEDLETEMTRRGMIFEMIDWRENQTVACVPDQTRAPALSKPERGSSPPDPAAFLRNRIAAILEK
jgi:hypothetical protein